MNAVMTQLHQYKSDLESKGHHVYAIMLKGSQNYNLHDSESDVDANAILIPSLSEIRHNKSYKYTYDTGEVTCHNIYSFADIVAKGNPQWSEAVNSKYVLGNSLDMFKKYIINPSALKGMFMEKVHALDKRYPSRAKYIDEYGWDGKQLHHLIRLYDLLLNDKIIHEYHGKDREYMLSIKRHKFPLTKEEAFSLRDEYVEKLNKIYEEKKTLYVPIPVDYEAIDTIVMQNYFKLYK